MGAHAGRTDHDGHPDRVTVFDRGLLHVEISKARNIRGDEILGMGRADAYLKVKHGNSVNPVTLKSEPHQDGGSNPTWGAKFVFPIRNGGSKEHNILDIEIWNKNRWFRHDNILGHVRIGELADWITRHRDNITEWAWYPVFTRHNRRKEEKVGDILIKFYFQVVRENVFREGFHTQPTYESTIPANGFTDSNQFRTVDYRREEGSRLTTVFGGLSPALGVAQSMIILLGLLP